MLSSDDRLLSTYLPNFVLVAGAHQKSGMIKKTISLQNVVKNLFQRLNDELVKSFDSGAVQATTGSS